MNKAELVEAVAAKAKLSKSVAEDAINAAVAAVEGALKKGDEVKVTGFGRLFIRKRKARKVTIPFNGQKKTIPASKTVAFKVSKALKEKL